MFLGPRCSAKQHAKDSGIWQSQAELPSSNLPAKKGCLVKLPQLAACEQRAIAQCSFHIELLSAGAISPACFYYTIFQVVLTRVNARILLPIKVSSIKRQKAPYLVVTCVKWIPHFTINTSTYSIIGIRAQRVLQRVTYQLQPESGTIVGLAWGLPVCHNLPRFAAICHFAKTAYLHK
jgi:hypothetical protein